MLDLITAEDPEVGNPSLTDSEVAEDPIGHGTLEAIASVLCNKTGENKCKPNMYHIAASLNTHTIECAEKLYGRGPDADWRGDPSLGMEEWFPYDEDIFDALPHLPKEDEKMECDPAQHFKLGISHRR